MRSCGWLILKFSRERSVWAPQYLSAGTWTSPNASVSALVSAMARVVLVKYLCNEGIERICAREVDEEREDVVGREMLLSLAALSEG